MRNAFVSLLMLLLTFSVLLNVPIAALADDPGVVTYTIALEDVDVEILSGTFTDADGTSFVVVNSEGSIELYCSTETSKLGGLPGEVVHLLDGSRAILTVACETPAAWRQQHRLSG